MKAKNVIETETPPLGFNAKLDNGDEVEWRYDPNARGYRMTKWWDDRHTRKREVLLKGMFVHQKYFNLELKAQEYREAGWTVTLL
jgi:hypothetical protein